LVGTWRGRRDDLEALLKSFGIDVILLFTSALLG
jgi:hypothetical protein